MLSAAVVVVCVLFILYVFLYAKKYFSRLPGRTKFDIEAAQATLKNVVRKRKRKRWLPSDYVFSPLKIRGMALRNRILKCATFESACSNCSVTDALIRFHLDQAKEAAMVTVSYGCVAYNGRTFSNQLLICDETMDGMKKLTSVIHSNTGAKISIQLTHAGLMAEPVHDRYSKNKSNAVISASSVWSWSCMQFTNAMTVSAVQSMITQFANAALICKKSGFDAITVHCGHGYLISQFLSRITNHRSDEYGPQSIASRALFAVSIVQQIRLLCGHEFPIFIKINSHDGTAGAMSTSIAESVQICKLLIDAGADVIIPTAGFISKNGIFMMRGGVPMVQMAMAATSMAKKIGIGLFGPWLIPQLQFIPMFLFPTSLRLLDGLLAVFRNMAETETETETEEEEEEEEKEKNIEVPFTMCYLGGVTNLQDMQRALQSGFELIGMSRALLAEPDFLSKIRKNPKHTSICDHQNRCIIGQFSGETLSCVFRNKKHKALLAQKIGDIEDLISS